MLADPYGTGTVMRLLMVAVNITLRGIGDVFANIDVVGDDDGTGSDVGGVCANI